MDEIANNIDPVWIRIKNLMKSRGLNQKEFAAKMRVTPTTVTDWKTGKSKSYQRIILLRDIADILGTTPEYLLGESDEKSPPTPEAGGGQAVTLTGEETRFLNAARRMRPEQRAILLELLEAALQNTSPEAGQIPARLSVVLPADAGTRTATGNNHP